MRLLRVLGAAIVINALAFLGAAVITTASAANLTTTTISSDFTPSLVAATVSGDTFVNDGNTFLVVTNGGGAPITVTITVQKPNFKVPDLGTVTFANVVVSVTNATTKWIAVPKGPYNNASNRVSVTYSAVTSVTVGAFKAP